MLRNSTLNKTFHLPRMAALACLLGMCLACGNVATNMHQAALAEDAKPAVDQEDPPENPFPRRIKSQDLDGGQGWLNTSSEISLKDLRGKVVLLDFWTYCCINCMHVLPDLKYIEEKYDKELVVIGVHSAKFDNEKDTENIRRAILRYEIKHPVINDADMTVWNKFGVNAWPTMVLIDPEGYYCGYISGEGNREDLVVVLDKVIKYHESRGTLDRTPVQFALESEKVTPTPLRFPGKILADVLNDRLFISDSNHNRIVVTSLGGSVRDIIGSGQFGRADGTYAEASFDRPQGMVRVGETLYVADTENHLLRAIDLTKKTVRTVAGTGQQAGRGTTAGKGLETPLNSPWDLEEANGVIYIAMAGPHQIWKYEIQSDTLALYAGNGREDVRNGDLLNTGALAQPSGLARDGNNLYVVDSEGSSIRRILMAEETIETVAGTSDLARGRSLFEFGDRDGIAGNARFQHPLGIVFHKGMLYVADTYNNKIRSVDPASGAVKTLLGDGKRGNSDAPARFFEPSGLTVAGNTLFIADTNNHAIRKVDLTSGKVSTLSLQGLQPPVKPEPVAVADNAAPAEEIGAVTVKAADKLPLEVTVMLPEGYKLNSDAPPVYRVKAEGAQSLIAGDHLGARHEIALPEPGEPLRISLPLAQAAGTAKLRISLTLNYCRSGAGGLCKVKSVHWSLPVTVAADAKESVVKLTATAK